VKFEVEKAEVEGEGKRTRNNNMPALVVWEPLVVAGDDLRCASSLFLVLHVLQLSLVAITLSGAVRFEHSPDVYVALGCPANEDTYWARWRAGIALLAFVLAYGTVGILVELAVCRTSGRGTPTETVARRRLVPLYKCKMVPLLLCRAVGFAFAAVALAFVEGVCACVEVLGALAEMENLQRKEGFVVTMCPLVGPRWVARVLAVTMACDVLFPAVTLALVLHRRVFRYYRRLRPARERGLEEQERLWQGRCRREWTLARVSALWPMFILSVSFRRFSGLHDPRRQDAAPCPRSSLATCVGDRNCLRAASPTWPLR